MSEVQTLPQAAAAKRRGPLAGFFIRLVKEKPLGTIGGVIVLVLLFCGIFADLVAPYDMSAIDLESILDSTFGGSFDFFASVII